jgi:hypothetical protein
VPLPALSQLQPQKGTFVGKASLAHFGHQMTQSAIYVEFSAPLTPAARPSKMLMASIPAAV